MMQSISPATMQRMMTAGVYVQGFAARFGWIFKWAQRNRTTAASMAALFAAMSVSWFMRWGFFARAVVPAAEAPEVNASAEEEEAPFAAGAGGDGDAAAW